MEFLYILQQALVWIITIFWLYQVMVSLCSLVKIKDKPLKVKKDHRFMAIVPAHNEEAVVANLVESLKKQNYNKTKTINSLVLFNEELKEKLKEMYEQKENKNKNDSFIQRLSD